MKKALITIFLLLFFAQYSLVPIFSGSIFGGAGIVAAFVVALCLRGNFQNSLIWSFCCGLFIDYFSVTPFGTYAIIFVLITGVVELYKTKLAQSKYKKLITFASIFTILIIVDILSLMILQTRVLWGEAREGFFPRNFDLLGYLLLKFVFAFLGVIISVLVGKTFDAFGMYSRDLKL